MYKLYNIITGNISVMLTDEIESSVYSAQESDKIILFISEDNFNNLNPAQKETLNNFIPAEEDYYSIYEIINMDILTIKIDYDFCVFDFTELITTYKEKYDISLTHDFFNIII
jgi:hypothetical protein